MASDVEKREREERAGRLVWARKEAGFKGPQQVAERFGFNVNNYKAHEQGRNGFSAAVGEQYADAFGVSREWLYLNLGSPTDVGPRERRVQLAGYVGAGQAVYQFDEGGAGDVESPPGAVPETVAVEVRGDSMLPLYEDGTVLFYSKQLPPDSMLGKRCVVRLEDERVLVKTLRRGSDEGLYSLLSLNAPDIEDVAVQWAAPIDWIKPR